MPNFSLLPSLTKATITFNLNLTYLTFELTERGEKAQKLINGGKSPLSINWEVSFGVLKFFLNIPFIQLALTHIYQDITCHAPNPSKS